MKNLIWVYIINEIISNIDNSNNSSKKQLFKFISFLILINHDILGDLTTIIIMIKDFIINVKLGNIKVNS